MPESSVQTQGNPNTESKPTEQATDDGVITLDVTKKYRSKRRPDVEIDGAELWALAGRGQEYDKLQSKFHQLQNADAQKDDLIAELQAKVSQAEARERVMQAYNEVNKQTAPQRQSTADSWLDDEDTLINQPQQQFNPVDIANRVEQITRDEFGNRLSDDRLQQIVDARLEQMYAQDREKRQAQERRSNATQKIKAAMLAAKKAKLPDVADAELREINDTEDAFMSHLINSMELLSSGNDVEGIERLLDAIEQRDAARDRELALMQRQGKLVAERERRSELEALSAGSLPDEEPDEEELKPAFRASDGEKKRKERLSRAKKMMDRMKVLRST